MTTHQLRHPAASTPDRSIAAAALHSVLRWPAAGTLAASAAFHVPVIAPHLHEAPYIGALFIALTLACLILAAALLIRDSLAAWTASGVVTALAVAAYVVSRTVGLPQIEDDIGNWTEPLGIASIAAETLTALLAAVAIAHWATATHRFAS